MKHAAERNRLLRLRLDDGRKALPADFDGRFRPSAHRAMGDYLVDTGCGGRQDVGCENRKSDGSGVLGCA